MDLLGDGFSQGWYLTALSSVLCVCGCFIVYVDDLYLLVVPRWITSKYAFRLKENYSFMNGSLGFSAGCLLFTALYRLLPEAMNHLTSYSKGTNSNATVTHSLSFIGGMFICLMFNAVLHVITSESVVHCSHDAEDRHSLEVQHEHNHSHLASSTAKNSDIKSESETKPLLTKRASQKLTHLLLPKEADQPDLGECKGYSSAELCLHNEDKLHFCEIPQLDPSEATSSSSHYAENTETGHSDHSSLPNARRHSGQQHGIHVLDCRETHHQEEIAPGDASHQSHAAQEHHHHHINSPLSRLLLIGVQTILAITLHKLPEGFITYVTSETNPELGFSIFLSLLIHNFTEGFLMCLPLYYSFKGNPAVRKFKAVSISAILGGLSQPLGALAGYFFIKANQGDAIDLKTLDYVFGITIAVTSGFLTVIALSMFASGVAFSGRASFMMVWAILGMCVISVLNMLIET